MSIHEEALITAPPRAGVRGATNGTLFSAATGQPAEITGPGRRLVHTLRRPGRGPADRARARPAGRAGVAFRRGAPVTVGAGRPPPFASTLEPAGEGRDLSSITRGSPRMDRAHRGGLPDVLPRSDLELLLALLNVGGKSRPRNLHRRLHERLDRRPGIVAGRRRARRSAGERGPLLQEQVRPRLHRGACEQGQEDHRLGASDPQGRTRHRHRVSPARGDGLPGREHPDGLRLLRERTVDQRDVHRRRRREARGRVQALRWDGSPRGARLRSSSRGRSRSSPEPSAARTSSSRTSTDRLPRARYLAGRSDRLGFRRLRRETRR